MNPKTPTGLEPDTHVRPQLPPESKTVPPRKSSGKGWVWLLLLVIAGAGAYVYWQRNNGASAGTTPAASEGGKSGKKGRGGGGPPPVVAARAKMGSIGVYVTGLGNVTPLYTEMVKSLVNGQLMDVHYKEGDLVKKGDPLIEIDPRPYQVALEQAQGQLVRDQALLANARVDQARYETLLKQNAIPEQQLATQKALVAQYEGTVKTDEGMVHSAELNLVYCHIKAEITGRIGLRLVDPGNIVHATDTNALLVITQIQPISVIFPISEKDLSEVRKRFDGGQSLTAEAWDGADSAKITTGKLATIDNQIDQTTGTVKLRASFDNKDNALFPNQFINVHLLVQQKSNVVLLPTAAIQRTTQYNYVWLLKPDNTVTAQKITEGVVENDTSEILSGLKGGDAVVMTGVDKLAEGTKVNATYQDGSGSGRGAGGRSGGKGQKGGANTPGNGGDGGTGGKKQGGGKNTK
jgi:multidrug efflux system membrane fusion protein